MRWNKNNLILTKTLYIKSNMRVLYLTVCMYVREYMIYTQLLCYLYNELVLYVCLSLQCMC